jgi:asparagine synthase (glutamine-hydrolysing)
MSVLFGRWNFDGAPVSAKYLDRVREILAPYAADGHSQFQGPGIAILHFPFHTTPESRTEQQPIVLRSGAVLTWDGRLDSRASLVPEFGPSLSLSDSDATIVAAAYEHSEHRSFAQLVGDWALAVWSPGTRTLVLARDFLGTRPLYYHLGHDQLTWSTLLEPLVLAEHECFAIDEEYLAGWLGKLPAAHLTPYRGILAVPPASYFSFHAGKARIVKYWDFDPSKQIRYATDAEYEEHFRHAFAESVRRRLRSDRPVLAELSGGMDSSSVVCMADNLAGTSPISTVSYFNDSEPHWNERPYFSAVEEKRGHAGCHIDVGAEPLSHSLYACERYAPTPGSATPATESRKRFTDCLVSGNHRVVLSGIGGDEVLGGVPTPVPELANLLAQCRFRSFAQQLRAWALVQRKPILLVLADSIAPFWNKTRKEGAPWATSAFAKRHRAALRGYEKRIHLFGTLPSFEDSLSTLDGLRRELACSTLAVAPSYERRYPYLDRDLLEFLYAIPREQLVRPGQRRSLMRRALRGIVPDVILTRRRKAFVARRPILALRSRWADLNSAAEEMILVSLGIVDRRALAEALARADTDMANPLANLSRTLSLESWLRHTAAWGTLQLPAHNLSTPPAALQKIPSSRTSEVHP